MWNRKRKQVLGVQFDTTTGDLISVIGGDLLGDKKTEEYLKHLKKILNKQHGARIRFFDGEVGE